MFVGSQMDGWVGRWLGKSVDGQVNGWRDRWTDRGAGGWVDGKKEGCIRLKVSPVNSQGGQLCFPALVTYTELGTCVTRPHVNRPMNTKASEPLQTLPCAV